MPAKNNLIVSAYQGIEVAFTEEAWFNATSVAAAFSKRVNDWISLSSTKDYIETLFEVRLEDENRSEELSLLTSGDRNQKIRFLNSSKLPTRFVKVKRGGKGKQDSTWFHPDLAVPFARWLNTRFAIWCDGQIRSILTQSHPRFDWKRQRHETAASHKVMSTSLLMSRTEQGKETKAHHYSNEARLVNWALTGAFKGIDRDALPYDELNLLAKLEAYDSVLIGRGHDYDARKLLLDKFAKDWRDGRLSNSIAAAPQMSIEHIKPSPDALEQVRVQLEGAP